MFFELCFWNYFCFAICSFDIIANKYFNIILFTMYYPVFGITRDSTDDNKMHDIHLCTVWTEGWIYIKCAIISSNIIICMRVQKMGITPLKTRSVPRYPCSIMLTGQITSHNHKHSSFICVISLIVKGYFADLKMSDLFALLESQCYCCDFLISLNH